jgi:hypothetical protein
MADIVVAVPKSQITAGREYKFLTATASQILSLPRDFGLFKQMFKPVFSSVDTTMTLHLKILSTALFNVDFNCGTTVEIIAPWKFWSLQPLSISKFKKSIAYSSSILVETVEILDENSMVSSL